MLQVGIKVAAGAHERRWCPVTVQLKPDTLSWTNEEEPLNLIASDDAGLTYPAQAERASDGTLSVTWLLPRLAAGTSKHFTLTTASESARSVDVREGDGETVDIMVAGKLFTRYNYGRAWNRPFLYPVIGPAGVGVTRNFPMRVDVAGERHDHPHHKSIYFTHGDVNGVNNWSDLPGHGFTRHQRFTRIVSGPVFGELAGISHWVDQDERPYLEQDLSLRVYALPGEMRLVDVSLGLTALHGDVVFGDTKEGGLLAVRVATTMDASGVGRIETGTGAVGEGESWGRPAPWCHYSGPVKTSTSPIIAGIGVMDHPGNPRYPTHWHVRNYGLMTANPFGLSDYYKDKAKDGSLRLAEGASAVFKYRIVIHEGDAKDGHMGDLFSAFAYPPQAELT